MHDLLLDLIDSAAGRASYADVRHVRRREETVALRGPEPDGVDAHDEEGFGVRVRVGGAWGFAATNGCDLAAAERALERALATAESQPRVDHRELAPAAPAKGSYASPVAIDPFEIPLEDKLALLDETTTILHSERGVSVARATVQSRVEEKVFASTQGALCDQRLTECGGGLEAFAIRDGMSQRRSYPLSYAGHVAQAGWEHVLALDLPDNAPRIAAEAVELLDAPACPEGVTTLVLAGEQLALQLHESVGHAVELDRVLGEEASYAGTSWFTADQVNALRYGSNEMSITADATLPGGLGSARWDDEGVESQRIPIVREGILCGLLSSRESAAEVGLARSGGCMRADGFARQPIVRMTNVSLDPGSAGSLEDLIGEIDRGIYIESNRSWSIDSRRLHFQFGGEAAREIVDGRLGRLLRDPVYSGMTPTFWAGLQAVCSPVEWRLVPALYCGKGEPGQEARVSHGCAPARFGNVQVGSA